MTRELSVRTILRRIERKIRSIEGELYPGLSPKVYSMPRRSRGRLRFLRGRVKSAAAG